MNLYTLEKQFVSKGYFAAMSDSELIIGVFGSSEENDIVNLLNSVRLVSFEDSVIVNFLVGQRHEKKEFKIEEELVNFIEDLFNHESKRIRLRISRF